MNLVWKLIAEKTLVVNRIGLRTRITYSLMQSYVSMWNESKQKSDAINRGNVSTEKRDDS